MLDLIFVLHRRHMSERWPPFPTYLTSPRRPRRRGSPVFPSMVSSVSARKAARGPPSRFCERRPLGLVPRRFLFRARGHSGSGSSGLRLLQAVRRAPMPPRGHTGAQHIGHEVHAGLSSFAWGIRNFGGVGVVDHHRLAVVVDVLVDGDDDCLWRRGRARRPRGPPLLEMGRVELEGTSTAPSAALGGELGGGGHGVAAGVDQRPPVDLSTSVPLRCRFRRGRGPLYSTVVSTRPDLAAGDDLVAVGVGDFVPISTTVDGLPSSERGPRGLHLHAGGGASNTTPLPPKRRRRTRATACRPASSGGERCGSG